MKNPGVCICVVVALLSPGLTSGQTRWQELADAIADMQANANVPALGLVIFDNHQPVLTLASGPNITEATPFRWGSITKTFTAMALLNLAYERNLPVESPVATLLPTGAFNNGWSAHHPVRLIQLAELTAGFADLSGAEFSDNTARSPAEVVKRFPDTRSTAWPPGLQHSYSNLTPGLSSMVVEALTGRSFEAYLHDAVLTPLGMQQASLIETARLPGGFKADGVSEIPYWHMTYAAFGALNASLAEMRSFVSALLNEGQLAGKQAIRPQVFTHLFKAQTSLGVANGLQVAYAAGMYGQVANGHVFHGHGGDADGYRSRYGVLPGHGRGYLVVINTDNPDLLARMVRRIVSELTIDLPAPVVPAEFQHVSEDLQALGGAYYPASARFGIDRWKQGEGSRLVIRVKDDGKSLLIVRNGREVHLIATGRGQFRRMNDPQTTVVFARDPAGNLYMQGELGNYVNLLTCPAFIGWCNSIIMSDG